MPALSDGDLLTAGVPPDRLRDPAYVKAAAILDDMEMFDPAFFGLSPRDGAIMDPQHRHFLECAWEALEHARIDPLSLKGSPTGVYVGVMYHDYDGADGGGSLTSGRISYTLGLQGPAVSLDTACSSSLVALRMAMHALRTGAIVQRQDRRPAPAAPAAPPGHHPRQHQRAGAAQDLQMPRRAGAD